MNSKAITTSDGSLTMKLEDQEENFHGSIGARRESKELYIKGSGFDQYIRAQPSCNVLDIGLGLGYNALSTIESWQKALNPCKLDMISLEIKPELVKQLRSGHAPWQANWDSNWINVCQNLKDSEQKNTSQLKLQHPSNNAQLNLSLIHI